MPNVKHMESTPNNITQEPEQVITINIRPPKPKKVVRKRKILTKEDVAKITPVWPVAVEPKTKVRAIIERDTPTGIPDNLLLDPIANMTASECSINLVRSNGKVIRNTNNVIADAIIVPTVNISRKLMGEIYKVTSPTSEAYIGQVVCFLANGTKRGVSRRFKEHCKQNSGCRALSEAIKLHGWKNMVVEVLIVCELKDLDKYETYFIELYGTLHPNGYNLTTGGSGNGSRGSRSSEETKKKISVGVRKAFEGGQTAQHRANLGASIHNTYQGTFTPEHKAALTKSLIGRQLPNRVRKDGDTSLPKYVSLDKNGRAYNINYWPTRKTKSYGKLSREENLELALAFLKKCQEER